jgi:hypothetical protein
VAICGGAANADTSITSEARKTQSATTSAATEFYYNSHSPIIIFTLTAVVFCGVTDNATTRI